MALLPTSGIAANGKPILDWDGAAAQLTRTGNSWSPSLGQPATITYAFRATAPSTMPDGVGGFQQFNTAQIIAAEAALQLWSDVANITFVRVGTGTSGAGAYSNNATILFADYRTETDPASAFAFLPSPGATGSSRVEGDVWVDISQPENAAPVFGDFGPHVLAHEIGHAIGLNHPGNYNGGSPDYQADAVYWQDARMFTVMSYFGSTNSGGNLPSFAWGPQYHDIAAVQRLYGANMTTRTGDTIYGFNSNAGRSLFEINSALQGATFSIWDAGGEDTLDLSGYSENAEIDLREGAFSSAGPTTDNGPAHLNLSIAVGVTIENAIGGSGRDTLTGNSVANSLNGGAGADSLIGAAGDDTLLGGDQADRLLGYDGADVLWGGAGNDAVFGGAGSDWADAGSGADSLDGGDGADSLDGSNGNDVLTGGADADSLSGGLGKDTIDGGDSSDFLSGGDTGDVIFGGALSDTIFGDAGSDLLDGGDEADSIIAHSGRDTVIGGAGDDNADAGAGDDLADGQTGKDSLAGGSGFDTLHGGAGNDVLQGGSDADSVFGDGGYDVLFGDDGDDVIEGGDLNDILFGNGGDDIFVFHPGDDVDTLRDFTAGAATSDAIRLIGFGSAFTDFAAVIAAATDDGVDTTINLGGGDMLIVKGIIVADLDTSDFLFG